MLLFPVGGGCVAPRLISKGSPMAKVKFGAIVTGLRGTVGGLTFTAGKGGPYVRTWAHPSNPFSVKQSFSRGYLATVSAAWASTSSAQKTAWDVFAALPAQVLTNSLGISYSCSGFQWFVKLNVRLTRIGRVNLVAAPVGARPVAPTISSITCIESDSTDSTLTYPALEFGPTYDLILFARLISAPGAVSIVYNFSALLESQVPGGTFVLFQDELEDFFGTVISGSKLFAHVYRQTDEGQRSAATAISALVA